MIIVLWSVIIWHNFIIREVTWVCWGKKKKKQWTKGEIILLKGWVEDTVAKIGFPPSVITCESDVKYNLT